MEFMLVIVIFFKDYVKVRLFGVLFIMLLSLWIYSGIFLCGYEDVSILRKR